MNFSDQAAYTNENNPFMRHCGITITQVRRDWAQAEMTAVPDYFNPGGTLHGGAFYTLADAAATTAARTDGHRYATIDGSIQYHRAITSGLVRAVATVRHRGHSVCSLAVEITDESGLLLADASFSAFRLEAIQHPAFSTEETGAVK